MKSRKSLILITILITSIIILLAGAIIYFYTSLGWKIYLSKDYEFMFRYPRSWKSISVPSKKLFYRWVGTFQTNEFMESPGASLQVKGARLIIYVQSPSNARMDFIANQNVPECSTIIRDDKNIMIGKQNSRILIYQKSNNCGTVPQDTMKDNSIYGIIKVLTRETNDLFEINFVGENEETLEILNQILSTFKFLDMEFTM